MQSRVSLTFLACALLLAPACAKSKFSHNDSAKTGSTKTDGEVQETSGSDKVSDDSEGVPGYLTDPEFVSAKRAGDNVQVSGKPGTVVSLLPKGSPIEMAIWAVTKAGLERYESGAELDGKAVGAKFLSAAPVAEDGSFTSEFVPLETDSAVFTTVEKPSSGASRNAVLQPTHKGHYRAAISDLITEDGPARFSGVAGLPADKDGETESSEAAATRKAAVATLVDTVPEDGKAAVQTCLSANKTGKVPASYRRVDKTAEWDDIWGTSDYGDPFWMPEVADDGKAELIHVIIHHQEVTEIDFKFPGEAGFYCLDVVGSFFNAKVSLGCKTRFAFAAEKLSTASVTRPASCP